MAWSLGSGVLAFGLGSRFPELGEMLDFGGWLIQVGREAFAGSPAGQELAGGSLCSPRREGLMSRQGSEQAWP